MNLCFWRSVSSAIGGLVTLGGSVLSVYWGVQLRGYCVSLANFIPQLLSAPFGSLNLPFASMLNTELMRHLADDVLMNTTLSTPVSINGFQYNLDQFFPGAPTVKIPGVAVPASVDASAIKEAVNASLQSFVDKLGDLSLTVPLPNLNSVLPAPVTDLINQLLQWLPSVCLTSPIIVGCVMSLIVGVLVGVTLQTCCHPSMGIGRALNPT